MVSIKGKKTLTLKCFSEGVAVHDATGAFPLLLKGKCAGEKGVVEN